jgi:succinoglycan biosynthesis protein ExoU
VLQTLIDMDQRSVGRTAGSLTSCDGEQDATPPVDVIIAALNCAQTIERAVKSALAEPEVHKVIVIDDGSNDDTFDLARKCDPIRVIGCRLLNNTGPAGARNAGIELSKAPWIAILDGDDFFLPGRIKALLAHCEDRDVVADNLLEIDQDKIGQKPLVPVFFSDDFQAIDLDLEKFVLGNVSKHKVIRRELGFLKPILRRSFLDRHRLRYDERLRLGEDYALYARALAHRARFLMVPAAGYVSVVRADSLSARHTRHDLEQLRDSDRYLKTKHRLTPAERRAVKRHYSSVDCRVQWLIVIEAVKTRNYPRLFRTFCRSPSISAYLAKRLLEESYSRAMRRLKHKRDEA